MIEVIDRQRKIKLNRRLFHDFSASLTSQILETGNRAFTVVFVSDKKMRELNKAFRRKTSTTDVLSFPFEPDEFEIESKHLGDIIISVEQAERQATENNLDFETEIKQLILHGVLHLCGYDHETDSGEMNALELKLRDKLQIT